MKTERKLNRKSGLLGTLFLSLFLLLSFPASAHCDSYDGPVIKEALKALELNKVELVYKWIAPEQEPEITLLFNKTYRLRSGDKEIYAVVERHFLETLVRLHRETEGAAFTGIKPAGSMTPLVEKADNSLENGEAESVIRAVTAHLEELIRERFTRAIELSKTKDRSVKDGRAYVEAYVEYTHTLEALEHVLHADHAH